VEQDEFDKTVWISNPNSRKFKFLNWGKSEFLKLLLFFLNNLKTPNMKVAQLFVLYNFHVDHFLKFPMDFELEV
jgi:hypothetical protein